MTKNESFEINVLARLHEIERKIDSISSLQSNIDCLSPVTVFRPIQTEDVINIKKLWFVVMKGKWIVLSSIIFCSISSILFSLSLPNEYRSDALLAPVDEGVTSGLSNLAGQFGGLASMAGINLGDGSGDKAILAIEILKSRQFVSKFIEKHSVLVPLMAANGWSREHNKIIIDPDIYDEKNKQWVREVAPPRSAKPSEQEAYKVFMEKLSVSRDKDTGFVTISFEFYSPIMVKEWIDSLIYDVNEELRTRDVNEALKSIEYLSEQMDQTPLANMQTIFYELIEEQTKTVMFSKVRDEYVFKTVDEAVVPELKSKPNRAVICLLSAILGGIISVGFILVREQIASGLFKDDFGESKIKK